MCTYIHYLEKEMATHSSTVWKIPCMKEPGRQYSPWGHKELDTTEQLHSLIYTTVYKTTNGNHCIAQRTLLRDLW